MTACKFCKSPHRVDLERALATGTMTQQQAADLIGTAKSSINRHLQNHLTPVLRNAIKENHENDRALDVAAAISEHIETVREWLHKAEEAGNIAEIMLVLKEERKSWELVARIKGLFNGETKQVNVLMNPEFIQLKNQIYNSLDPEARVKLAEALEAINL